jgi:hypothetical protein
LELSKFLKSCVETFFESTFLPTGHDLLEELYIVAGVTLVTFLLEILGFPHIYNIGGCMLALIIVIIALAIERKEYSEISRLYRFAELQLSTAKSRVKGISKDIKSAVSKSRPSGIAKNNAKRSASRPDDDSEAGED